MGDKDLKLKRMFMNKAAAASLIGYVNYHDGNAIHPECMRLSNPEHISLAADDTKNRKRKKNKSVTCDLCYAHDEWNTDYGLELQSYVDYFMAPRLVNEYGTVFSGAKHELTEGTGNEMLSKFGKDEKLYMT